MVPLSQGLVKQDFAGLRIKHRQNITVRNRTQTNCPLIEGKRLANRKAESPSHMPVPLKLTVCGLPGSLSLMTRVADRAPAALGLERQVDRAAPLAGYRTPRHTGRAGLNCEVSRIRAAEGETRNAQRRVAQVGQRDSLWGAGGVHGLWAEVEGRRGEPHRRPRAPQVDGLRAAGIAVTDDKGSGPYSGCGGFERHVDRAVP